MYENIVKMCKKGNSLPRRMTFLYVFLGVQLLVTRKVEAVIYVDFEAGEDATLPCNGTDNGATEIVRWQYDNGTNIIRIGFYDVDEEMYNEDTDTRWSTRTSVTDGESGELTIYKTVSDDNGTYLCDRLEFPAYLPAGETVLYITGGGDRQPPPGAYDECDDEFTACIILTCCAVILFILVLCLLVKSLLKQQNPCDVCRKGLVIALIIIACLLALGGGIAMGLCEGWSSGEDIPSMGNACIALVAIAGIMLIIDGILYGIAKSKSNS